ncbi:low temperature requirement protein A [Pleurocapsa sp. CCALA 161]|uniref:low temperature requirement protein A n=1 Tax=Pleurocapsa sp. CCALA 161 TaxID=2107688 RepID=UPI000D05642B|nr:low temperature requirement protein A [Pleurocapsa sp. CCALA 161]PSB10785.1 low temperature requirement protein A [Pleurocapsa sp. CCALA 161]
MTRVIFQPPKLRLEECEDGERKVTWLELFFDLIFVVAIAQLAHNFHGDFSLVGLAKLGILFIPVWWCWTGAVFYDTRFNNDGLIDRLITLIQMAISASLAANIHHGLSTSSMGFALSYIAFRALLICQYLHAGYHVPQARLLTNWYTVGFSLSLLFWLASVFVPLPWRLVLWGVGLIIDFATPLSAGQRVAKVPPNLAHITERIGLFTIIVLGESIVSVVGGVSELVWTPTSIAIALLGLSIAFSFWWMYFDTVDESPLHAMRVGKMIVALTWLYSHLPLAVGLTATGVGVEKMISGLDSDATRGEKVLFCLAVALCLMILSNLHWTSCELGQTKCKKILTYYRLGAAAFVLTLAFACNFLSSLVVITLVAFACGIQIVLDIFNTCP